MRFDDRLETALGNKAASPGARQSKWRQLLDLLSRADIQQNFGGVARGLTELSILSEDVDDDCKVDAIHSLSGRLISPPLLSLLASDSPRVASAAMAAARLSDAEWRDLIPELPSRARGFLRNRRDLGPLAVRTLDDWASADFRLGYQYDMPAAVAPMVEVGPSAASENLRTAVEVTPESVEPVEEEVEASAQEAHAPVNGGERSISELVARIERYRRENDPAEVIRTKPIGEGQADAAPAIADRFIFMTDDSGTITEALGLPRGAIVGTTLADPAYDNGPGPDAGAASAFRQRLEISGGRMRLCGGSAAAGDWRIFAKPVFDQRSGRFRGYRGIMRRPNAAEDAVSRDKQQDPDRGEYLQQLVHELRSPLNAITGFAEIIEQQFFGPVSHPYREMAHSILADARRLLAGFDDLNVAAKLDSGQYRLDEGTGDPDWLIARLVERLQSLTESRGIVLNIRKVRPLRHFAVEPDQLERLFSRLLSAVILACSEGEELRASLKTLSGTVPANHFSLTLPRKLACLSEDDLLDVGHEPAGEDDDPPVLGLGFSFRLVRNLARSAEGSLRFQNGSALLVLPAAGHSVFEERGREQE